MANTPKQLISALNMLTAQVLSSGAAVPEAAARHQRRVRRAFDDPNIVAVGISEKVTGRKKTGDLAVCFYVVKKQPIRKISPDHLVPPVLAVNGKAVFTDVKEVGKIVPQIQKKASPLQSGFSIGHSREDAAGTLGALVRKGGKLHVLSNSHVLARAGKAKIGDAIVYPGKLDGGKTSKNTVAHLSEFVPFVTGEVFKNRVDAALAEVAAERIGDVDFTIHGVKKPLRTIKPKRGMVITKRGRTTGFTEGEIEDVNFRVVIDYGGVGKVAFLDQVLCRRYSQGGDSGSIIVDKKSGKIVGLHFAGSPQGSVFTPIGTVIDAMKFKFTSK
jgi:hypothetical protein